MIKGDSTEYELLAKWCAQLQFYEEPKSVTSCEIGVREGLGSKIIMLGIRKRIGNIPYEHIAIDPYNNLSYQHYDVTEPETADYTDEMRLQMERDFANEKDFKFYHLTDVEFMNLFNTSKRIFDLVFFDGPHMTKDIFREAIWFADKSRKGTRFVFDDTKYFDIETIIKALSYWDFEVLEYGKNKVCLQKDK
jgi:hypothetical protein|tara:strand:+ start:1599 stop:2174 length:576 start_codon:yes stop_codon:yes gene_type:complete